MLELRTVALMDTIQATTLKLKIMGLMPTIVCLMQLLTLCYHCLMSKPQHQHQHHQSLLCAHPIATIEVSLHKSLALLHKVI
jgi:hypothetical protein